MRLVGTVADPDADFVALLSSAGLPMEDLHKAGRVFLRFTEPSDLVVGVGGYEPLGGAVLLRSIVVAPERRGEGFGDVPDDARLRADRPRVGTDIGARNEAIARSLRRLRNPLA